MSWFPSPFLADDGRDLDSCDKGWNKSGYTRPFFFHTSTSSSVWPPKLRPNVLDSISRLCQSNNMFTLHYFCLHNLYLAKSARETIAVHKLHPYFDMWLRSKGLPTASELDCNTAVNNAIRHVFTYHRWQSVRSLRENFGYKSLSDIFSATKRKFAATLPSHHNSVISRLALFISTANVV